jgi:histidine ammonia-lyase
LFIHGIDALLNPTSAWCISKANFKAAAASLAKDENDGLTISILAFTRVSERRPRHALFNPSVRFNMGKFPVDSRGSVGADSQITRHHIDPIV